MISLLLTGQVGIGPGALFSPKVLHCSVMHRNTLLIVTGGGGGSLAIGWGGGCSLKRGAVGGGWEGDV